MSDVYRLQNFTIQTEVTVRSYRQNDWRQLKWCGSDLYQSAWEEAWLRKQSGEIEMLVAVMHEFCVGRVWVDFTRRAQVGVGLLWALDVIPAMQSQNIGSLLIQTGEQILQEKGFANAELGVSRQNTRAQQLYQRLGYVTVAEQMDSWHQVLGSGVAQDVVGHVYLMQKKLN